MGSGDEAHDLLTCRGRLRAWEGAGEEETVAELPEGERELAPVEEGRVAMPAWASALDGEIVAVAEEDLDRVWRHLGAADLGQVLFEAAALLRDEMRARHVEVCPEDADEVERVEDERAMTPLDEIVVLACGRWYAVELPHHLLDECYGYEPEPAARATLSWPTLLGRAVVRFGEWLDERAGRDVPYVPGPARPYFVAAPIERTPADEARRWLESLKKTRVA